MYRHTHKLYRICDLTVHAKRLHFHYNNIILPPTEQTAHAGHVAKFVPSARLFCFSFAFLLIFYCISVQILDRLGKQKAEVIP